MLWVRLFCSLWMEEGGSRGEIGEGLVAKKGRKDR